MRIVHISYKYGLNNTGGAAIAATRLHNALLSNGIESFYICIWKCEEGVNVYELPARGTLARVIYIWMGKLLRNIWTFTKYKKKISLNILPLVGLEKLLNRIQPDVIHVHWINADVMSMRQLSQLKYQTIINLHDLFMVNIVKPHPGNDRRYIEGVTSDNSSFLERWLFNRKKHLVQYLSPAFIGPSKWVCKCAKSSIIGRGCLVYQIPNIISRAFYYRENLRTRHDKFEILFGAYSGRHNAEKGFPELEKALRLLPERIKRRCELLVFGEDAQDCETAGVQTHFLGNLSNPEELVAAYHKADVFVFPSIAETQGMTKIEALLCGVPTIAFDRTACAEGIDNGVTGWVAKDGDVKAFAESLVRQYEICFSGMTPDEIHRPVARRAKELFDVDMALKQVIDVYQTLSKSELPVYKTTPVHEKKNQKF